MRAKAKPIELVAYAFSLILVLGMVTILGLAAFTSQVQLDVGTMFALEGVTFLAGTAVLGSVDKMKGASKSNISALVFLVSFGLGWMVRSQKILSVFFFVAAAFCWVFWLRGAIGEFRRLFGPSGNASKQ